VNLKDIDLSKIKISKLRTFFYKAGAFLGDINAIKNGTILQRIRNRLLGKLRNKFFNKRW
jgi:hypothetical protein